ALAYTIHHVRSPVHHCLSVDSRCLRKEGGRISRTAWPIWASWPCRPPKVERSFVLSMENVARPARLHARLTNVSSVRLPSARAASSFLKRRIGRRSCPNDREPRPKSFSRVLRSEHSKPSPLMGWTRRAPAPARRIAGSGLQNQEHSMPHNTSRLEAVATIGIDIGKNTFHLVGLDRNGAIVLRQKLSRRQIEARLANTPPCLIGMEACVGAHHLSRQLKAYGHDARLMPAR